jgi:hypothetical protein
LEINNCNSKIVHQYLLLSDQRGLIKKKIIETDKSNTFIFCHWTSFVLEVNVSLENIIAKKIDVQSVKE